MANAGPIRVLLVEDNAAISRELRDLLGRYANIEIVGEAPDGEEGVLKASQLEPAVVVMDIAMPRMNGITATRLIKVNCSDTAVIGLSVITQRNTLDAMLKAGAAEIVSKEEAVDHLYGAILRAVGSHSSEFYT